MEKRKISLQTHEIKAKTVSLVTHAHISEFGY